MRQSMSRKYFWVGLFGIAFGMIEAAVVIYLRALYYPEGFSFPLQLIGPDIAMVEITREIATMLLLVSVALVAGRTFRQAFAWFIYAFAVWDIFYYVFLYVFLGWPESLMTWDILFLLPFTWVGPVFTPLINSLSMIALAIVLLYFGKNLRMYALHWIALILGALIIIWGYTKDYLDFMMQEFRLGELLGGGQTDAVIVRAGSFVPEHFSWGIFSLGVGIHILVILDLIRRSHKRAGEK